MPTLRERDRLFFSNETFPKSLSFEDDFDDLANRALTAGGAGDELAERADLGGGIAGTSGETGESNRGRSARSSPT